MADEADLAQHEEALHLSLAIKAHANTPRLMPTGYCRDPLCEEDVPEGALFCGVDCRDSFDRMADSARRRGIRFP